MLTNSPDSMFTSICIGWGEFEGALIPDSTSFSSNHASFSLNCASFSSGYALFSPISAFFHYRKAEILPVHCPNYPYSWDLIWCTPHLTYLVIEDRCVDQFLVYRGVGFCRGNRSLYESILYSYVWCCKKLCTTVYSYPAVRNRL